jgi:hypothetical protein
VGLVLKLTATKVPGRKIMPSNEMVFMEELSFLVSRAIVLIMALSSLLAFVMAVEFSASDMLTFASFCAIN